MMTQNVKTQTVNLFPDTKAGKSSSANKSSNKDFNSIMDNNLKSKSTDKDDNAAINTNTNGSKPDQAITDKDKPVAASQSSEADTKAVNDNTQTAGQVISDIRQDNQQTDILDENTELAGYMDIIQNILAMLQNTVQSNLGITNEELSKAMEDLGFTAMDLFNPDNLKQLVLQINGSDDITAALTDENLADTINQLIQAVDDLKSDPDLPITKEELTDIINRFQKSGLTEAQVQETPLKSVPEIKEQEVSNVSKDDKQNDITFEVHKTTDKETESDVNQSFTNEADSKEKEVKTQSPIDTFIQNLAVKGNDTGLSFTEQIANVRQMQDITRQIVEQIKIIIKPEQTSMEIQLNPESLGKINLSVVAKDGIMTAHFTAQNEMAKEAIESQMQVLKDNLNNQGLKVESIEVTVSNFSFDQSNQASAGSEKEQQNQSRNRNINAAEADTYGNENETQDIGLMEQTGSSIDFTA